MPKCAFVYTCICIYIYVYIHACVCACVNASSSLVLEAASLGGGLKPLSRLRVRQVDLAAAVST